MKSSLNLIPASITYRALQALMGRLKGVGFGFGVKLNASFQTLWNAFLNAMEFDADETYAEKAAFVHNLLVVKEELQAY